MIHRDADGVDAAHGDDVLRGALRCVDAAEVLHDGALARGDGDALESSRATFLSAVVPGFVFIGGFAGCVARVFAVFPVDTFTGAFPVFFGGTFAACARVAVCRARRSTT